MQETVVGFMKDNFLLWESIEHSSTLVATVLDTVKVNMERSPASYNFVNRETVLRGHEGLGLTLLEFINRGHLNGNQAALRPTSYTASTTIDALLTDKVKFAVVAHNLGFYRNFFVINAGPSS